MFIYYTFNDQTNQKVTKQRFLHQKNLLYRYIYYELKTSLVRLPGLEPGTPEIYSKNIIPSLVEIANLSRHKLLSIIVRYAPILLSTRDPGSLIFLSLRHRKIIAPPRTSAASKSSLLTNTKTPV